MSKILIVRRCVDCPHSAGFYNDCRCLLQRRQCPKEGLPDWCTLPDLPERKEEMEYLAVGWNACLDEIEGG